MIVLKKPTLVVGIGRRYIERMPTGSQDRSQDWCCIRKDHRRRVTANSAADRNSKADADQALLSQQFIGALFCAQRRDVIAWASRAIDQAKDRVHAGAFSNRSATSLALTPQPFCG